MGGKALQTRRAARLAGVQIHLQRGEVFVNALLLEQLRMRTLRDDISLIHHDNVTGVLHGRKTVRDDKRRAPLHQVAQRIMDGDFVCRIKGRGRFVQQQDF